MEVFKKRYDACMYRFDVFILSASGMAALIVWVIAVGVLLLWPSILTRTIGVFLFGFAALVMYLLVSWRTARDRRKNDEKMRAIERNMRLQQKVTEAHLAETRENRIDVPDW